MTLASALRAAALAATLATPAPAQEDDLAALALSLVNDARSQAGLDEVTRGENLTTAAQAHADDMLVQGYYDHVSPEGATARDRFIRAGGDPSQVVAENIARCEGCEGADAGRVRAFQSGWMQSPGHRENILARGMGRFGFGIAEGDGVAYAVQMFAGPGTPPGAGPGAAERLTPEGAVAAALDATNETRVGRGLPELAISSDLNAVARAVAERAIASPVDSFDIPQDTFGLLPEGAGGWTSLAVSAASCGGCGAVPVAADIPHLVDGLGSQQGGGSREFTRFGFALEADGRGGKVAVAVYGRR